MRGGRVGEKNRIEKMCRHKREINSRLSYKGWNKKKRTSKKSWKHSRSNK